MATITPEPVPSRGLTNRYRDEADQTRSAVVTVNEIMLLTLMVGSTTVAWAFPFRSVKYGLILLFGVILMVQTYRRPAVGLALIAFATPAIDLIPPELFPVRGINVETVLGVYLLYIWYRAVKLYGKDGLYSPVSKMMVIYVIVIALASINAFLSWKVSLFDMFAAVKNHTTYFLYFPVALHTLRTKRDQLMTITTSMIALFLTAAQGIDHSWYAFVVGNLERHRATSILAPQSNIYGGAMAVYLSLFIVLALRNVGSRWLRIWSLVFCAACGFALILTLSRGSWVGAVIGLAFLSVFYSRKLLLVLIIAGASYQIWVPEQAVDRVKITAKTTGNIGAVDQIADDSTQMRVEQYRSLGNMMAPRPIFGWGYKSYPKVFEERGSLGRRKGAHSSFCLYGTEEGIIGLMLIGAFFVVLIWCGVSATRHAQDPLARTLGAGVACAAFTLLIIMASGSRFETQKVYCFFWIVAGIVERERLRGVLGLGEEIVDQAKAAVKKTVVRMTPKTSSVRPIKPSWVRTKS